MSKYTTEVRYIVEMNCSPEAKTVKDKIRTAAPKIFDFDFPIYDENHRLELEEKILKHYYVKEIGTETVGLWKLFLETKLNEIMPYYNELYKVAAIRYDPLSEYEESETFKGKTTSDGTNKSSGSGKSKSIDSDYPQAEVDINASGYASSSTDTEDSSRSENLMSNNGTNDYNIIKKGRHKSGALLIKEYKDVIMNIDLDIIEDLKNLFMLIY